MQIFGAESVASLQLQSCTCCLQPKNFPCHAPAEGGLQQQSLSRPQRAHPRRPPHPPALLPYRAQQLQTTARMLLREQQAALLWKPQALRRRPRRLRLCHLCTERAGGAAGGGSGAGGTLGLAGAGTGAGGCIRSRGGHRGGGLSRAPPPSTSPWAPCP